jgi:hypothetical protein
MHKIHGLRMPSPPPRELRPGRLYRRGQTPTMTTGVSRLTGQRESRTVKLRPAEFGNSKGMPMSGKGWLAWLAGGLVLAFGCASWTERPAAGDEGPVREAFVALQAALRARDAEKVWQLLDADSQADAERMAKAIRAAYAKANPEGKAEQEKALGLSGTELAALGGPGFLKTHRFLGRYDEIPDGKIEKITVQGDRAIVNYVEPDGDKEKLNLVKQDGQWKVSVPMPKGTP